MRERSIHITIRKIIYLFLLPALVVVCLAGAKPAYAAQSASDALDAAFFGEDDEEDWTLDEGEAEDASDVGTTETVTTEDALISDAGRFVFVDSNVDEAALARLDTSRSF